MLRFLAVALSMLLLVQVANGAPKAVKQQAQPKPPIGATPEALEVAKQIRTLEAKVDSGMNLNDYSADVANLNVAIVALDELLEARGDASRRQQLAAAYRPYQEAKELWSACASSGRDCQRGMIAMNSGFSAAHQKVKELLAEYPEMQSPIDKGGADATLIPSVPIIRWQTMLSMLWQKGKDQGKLVRQNLRDE